jgi:Protein of unknown function (DUF3703)
MSDLEQRRRVHVNHRKLRSAFSMYCQQAIEHEIAGRLDAAWACLEAAHILGQAVTRLHVCSHWRMFGLAWRTRDHRELIGQVTRMLAAIVVTRIWIPVGNPGRSHVSATARATIPEDLQRLMTELAAPPSSR